MYNQQQTSTTTKPPKEADYQAKRKAANSALQELMKPIKNTILFARVLTLISSLLAIAPYVALTKLGELLLHTGEQGLDQGAFYTTCKILISAFLLQAMFYLLALTLTHFADLRLRNQIQDRLIHRLSGTPLAWFSNSSTGKVRKAIQDDTVQVHTLVAHAPVEQTAAVATPLVLLIYAFWVDWRLGLLSIATFPIYALMQMYTMRDMGSKTAEMDEKLADVSARAIELSEGINVVKNFGHTGRAHSKFTRACQEFATFYWNWCGPLLRMSALSMSTISVTTLMAINLGLGFAMVWAGWVSVPAVLTCSLIALVLPNTINVLGSTAWAYQQAGAAALRVKDVLDLEQLEYPKSEDGDQLLARPQQVSDRNDLTDQALYPSKPTDPSFNHLGTVEFSKVSYAYPVTGGQIKALDQVSLRLEPGTVTALVGPSGSGKSTLGTMLARFRDPDQGTITIHGRDLKDFSEKELYRTVSFVLQDPYMQRRTLRQIVSLARPDATQEELNEAAQKAQILADIEALPAGWDTVLGEQTDFSGGQKQRLAIARALLADTPILVLDEATAATDPDCEAEIQRGLATLARGRTVLVIAHHAESVRGADQICVMERGKIIASGTAQELATQPYWAKLADRSHR